MGIKHPDCEAALDRVTACGPLSRGKIGAWHLVTEPLRTSMGGLEDESNGKKESGNDNKRKPEKKGLKIY